MHIHHITWLTVVTIVDFELEHKVAAELHIIDCEIINNMSNVTR